VIRTRIHRCFQLGESVTAVEDVVSIDAGEFLAGVAHPLG
jgi:hypothetical protein